MTFHRLVVEGFEPLGLTARPNALLVIRHVQYINPFKHIVPLNNTLEISKFLPHWLIVETNHLIPVGK